MTRDHGLAQIGTTYDLVDLFRLCIQDLGDVYLVIDGLDECFTDSFVGHLHWVTTHCQTKTLVFSRPNVAFLVRNVPSQNRIEVDRHSTNRDIRIYLTNQIYSLIDEEILPRTEDMFDLVEHLVKGADGMFLWATLMIKYLRLPVFNPEWRLRTIRGVILPEGLEKMYDRIMNHIHCAGGTQRELAGQALQWLAYSIRPLTIRQLGEALIVAKRDAQHMSTMESEDWQMTITVACGGLVEVICAENHLTKADDTYFRLIHLSAQEYIQKFRQAPTLENCGIQANLAINLELASICLKHLNLSAPKRPHSSLSGLYGDDSNTRMDMLLSFKSYASSFWMYHLWASVEGDMIQILASPQYRSALFELVTSLSCFLDETVTVTAWLETSYVISAIKTHDNGSNSASWITTLKHWTNKLERLPENLSMGEEFPGFVKRMKEFVNELHAIHKAWGPKLLTSPNMIWDEAAAFVKCRFLSQSSTARVTSLAPEQLGYSGSSSKSIAIISTTAPDARHTAVLSIWPSAVYERDWQNIDANATFSSSSYMCHGWLAKYEIFTVNDKASRTVDLGIHLDPTEVWLQLQQSFHKSSLSWKTSFSLAINEDILSFIVLRTLIVIQPSKNQHGTSYRSFTIPMDFATHLVENWTIHADAAKPYPINGFPYYTYSFTFSSNGRYICFSDCHMRCYAYIALLVVFQIQNSIELRADIVGANQCKVEHQEAIGSVTFHPRCDALAIYNDGQVYLWSFRSRKLPISLTLKIAILIINRKFQTHTSSEGVRY